MALIILAAGSAEARTDGTAPELRLAVAPFAGSSQATEGGVEEALARQLARRAGVEILSPLGLAQLPESGSPSARAVRQMAFEARLDALIFGRLGDADAGGVEIEVRSGHSGGTLGRHQAAVAAVREGSEEGEALVDAILRDLGWQPAPERLPPMAARDSQPGPPGSADGGSAPASRSSFFDFGSANRGEALQIDADELEFISLDAGGRRLLFKQNVRVVQGNVTLVASALEALYPEGESEPEKLVATGDVHVAQGDRTARCQRAVYRREAQTLVCTGEAELVSGCDIVRGTSIEFDLQRDRARVRGAASVQLAPRGSRGDGVAPGCEAAP